MSNEEKSRKQRDHPYTNQLNRIKSKICYYKKIMNDENDEKKKETINDAINSLEYERFILKLNPHDMNIINKFCSFNDIEIDVKDVLKQFVSE